MNVPLATTDEVGYNAALLFTGGFSMFDFLVFFANVPQPADGGGGDGSSLFLFFVMLPAFLILMWFLLANPHRKQEERLRKMLNSIEKNDKVMTVGGVIGTVHSIDREQNEIVLKVDESNNTRIRFHLTAVNTIFPKDGSGK